MKHNYQTGLQLITCVIQRGRADKVAKAALDAGAAGATVFFGRGMGLRERLGLLGLAIVPEKEIIMIVVRDSESQRIFDVVIEAANLDTPGMGIAYTSPITQVAGLFPVEEEQAEQTHKG